LRRINHKFWFLRHWTKTCPDKWRNRVFQRDRTLLRTWWHIFE
jgi:hypothetical protein